MIAYSDRVVARAAQLGWEIVVGDAPGIDRAVWEACDEMEVFCTVYGVAEKARNHAPESWYLQVPSLRGDWRDRYLARDRYMVGLAERCIGIWNGVSTGTVYTCIEARKRGIPTNLIKFSMEEYHGH